TRREDGTGESSCGAPQRSIYDDRDRTRASIYLATVAAATAIWPWEEASDPSPGARPEAPRVDAQVDDADSCSDPHQKLRRDIRVDHSLQIMDQKALVIGGQAGSVHQRLLQQRQRAVPGAGLDHDAVQQREDVEPPQKRAVAGQQAARDHPRDPDQVCKQNNLRQALVKVHHHRRDIVQSPLVTTRSRTSLRFLDHSVVEPGEQRPTQQPGREAVNQTDDTAQVTDLIAAINAAQQPEMTSGSTPQS